MYLRHKRLTKRVARWVMVLRSDPCSYCGYVPINGQVSTVDHIKPLIKGGALTDRLNMAATCQRCNRRKDNKSILRFLIRQQKAGKKWSASVALMPEGRSLFSVRTLPDDMVKVEPSMRYRPTVPYTEKGGGGKVTLTAFLRRIEDSSLSTSSLLELASTGSEPTPSITKTSPSTSQESVVV